MTKPKPLPFTQWAEIHRNERFISIEPLSGYRLIRPEDESHIIYLAPDAADDALGQALLDSLGRSRFIWPPDREFSRNENYMRAYQNWQQDMMRRYDYKTRRDAYKNMNWCRAERSEGTISITPHNRSDKPGEWLILPPEKNIVIPATEDVNALGAALRQALERCQ